MKRFMSVLLSLAMVLSLCACGSSSSSSIESANSNSDDNADISEFPLEGLWIDDSASCKLDISSDGTLIAYSVVTKTVTTSHSNSVSSTIIPYPFTWSVSNDQFIFNSTPYEMVYIDGAYKLVGAKLTFTKDDKALLSTEKDSEDASYSAEPYLLDSVITTQDVELQFTEMGIADDLRISSKESGLKIISGPNSESNKDYLYIKGTIKNISKSELWLRFSGNFTVDGYKYDVSDFTADSKAQSLSKIDPLDTYTVILYASIPNELLDNYESAELVFGFSDGFESLSLEDCDYIYSVTF